MGRTRQDNQDQQPDVAPATPTSSATPLAGGSNLPVPVSRFDPALMHRANLDKIEADYETSLPLATPEQRKQFVNMLNGTVPQLRGAVNLTLAIQHVTVCPADYQRDDGEQHAGIRVILTTVDGQHYSCGGVGPIRAIRRLIRAYGPLPFNPPLQVRVTPPIQLSDGKSTYTLEVV